MSASVCVYVCECVCVWGGIQCMNAYLCVCVCERESV